MKVVVLCATVVATLLTLVGCAGFDASNTPSFLTNDNLTRIEVMNDQNNQKGQASKSDDNLNELLNILNLGDLKPSSRENSPEPSSSAYTMTAYDQTQVIWVVQILDSSERSNVYLRDAVHPTNSGIYALDKPINIGELSQFIHKYLVS